MKTMSKWSPIRGRKHNQYLCFSRNGKNIAFDLASKEFVKFLKNGETRTLSYASVSGFFRGISYSQIAEGFKDESYCKLMKMAVRYCAKREKRKSNIGSILYYLDKVAHLESYILLDIQFNLFDWSRLTFEKPVNQFSKDTIRFMQESNIVFSSYNWEDEYDETINNICRLIRDEYYMDLEVYRMLYNVIAQGSWYRFQNLVTQYNCEYKALFRYLVKIERTEAIEFKHACELYADYLKMMKDMENDRVVKYPSGLRIRHDICARNYRTFGKKYDDVKFAKMVMPEYQYKKNDFCLIAPRKTSDIKKEGNDLHHCVGSYIDKVLDGTTQIMFLRNREMHDESLVTVEIRNNTIIQARGHSNRSMEASEKDWLKKYAKAKNLNYGGIKADPKLPSPLVKVSKYHRIGKPFMAAMP